MNSIAMLGDVLGDWAVGAQRGGEDKADFALLDYIGSSIALAGFRAGIGYQTHAKGGAVVVSGLARVPYVELDVVGALEGQKILAGLDRAGCKSRHRVPPAKHGAEFAGIPNYLAKRIGRYVYAFEG